MSKKPLNEFALDGADDQNDLMPQGEVDNEGAMAKADLYKLANYSVKLFKKINDEDQLESWVQAKITKAADYIASVYHYLEYELKFNEYGAKLDHSDMYSESEKLELKNKLNEAKEMLKAIKVAQAQKLEESKSPKAKKDYDKDGKIESEKDEVIGSRRKAAGLDESWDDDDEDDDVKRADSELKKKGVKLPKTKADPDKDFEKLAKKSKKDELDESYDDDDEDPDVKKADSELKKKGVKLPKVKHKEVPIKKTAKDKEEEIDEGKKPDFLDLDKDGNKKEPMKKAAKEKKIDEISDQTKKSYRDAAGKSMQKAAKEGDKATVSKRLKGVSASLKEGDAPSAGLSAKQKSSTVKKAKAGGDIGKPGKGFAKVEKAAKAGGAKDPKAVAAAAMWKNIKRESQQIDELSADTLKSYAKKKGDQMFVDKKPASGKDLTNYRKAIDKAHEKEKAVNESVELDAIKTLTKRLLG